MSGDKHLKFSEEGLVEIDGFSDARVGEEIDVYRPQDKRTDRVALLPNLVLITKDNVEKLKAKLEAKQGFVVKKMEEIDGKQVEVKYFCGHLFKAARVHFGENMNVRCLGTGKYCCSVFPREASLQIPIPIVKYQTGKDGTVKDGSSLDLEYMIWCLNEQTFARLRTTEKEWPLVSHDLLITGRKQGKYVRVENIAACAEALWRKQESEVLVRATMLHNSKVSRYLGRSMSEEQIREAMGQAPSNPSAGDASAAAGVNVDDLVNGL